LPARYAWLESFSGPAWLVDGINGRRVAANRAAMDEITDGLDASDLKSARITLEGGEELLLVTAPGLLERRARFSAAAMDAEQALVHVGSFIRALDGRDSKWSDECYRVLGLPVGSTASTEKFVERIHAQDRVRIAALILDSVGQGRDWDTEARIMRP